MNFGDGKADGLCRVLVPVLYKRLSEPYRILAMALKGLSLSNLFIDLKEFFKKMEVIGIDVSKLTLDCCIHDCGMQEKFKNDLEGIDQLSA